MPRRLAAHTEPPPAASHTTSATAAPPTEGDTRRALVSAILGTLTPAARLVLVGAFLTFLRHLVFAAASAPGRSDDTRKSAGSALSLFGEGLFEDGEHANAALALCSALWGTSYDGVAHLAATGETDPGYFDEALAALTAASEELRAGAPRLLRFDLGGAGDGRRPPGPRERLVRGIVGALPPKSAHNAVRSAADFLRALDSLDAILATSERHPRAVTPLGDRERAAQAINDAMEFAGQMAEFTGTRRTRRARCAIINALVGFDPAHVAQIFAEAGPVRGARSGVRVLERVLADLRGDAPAAERPRRRPQATAPNTSRPTREEIVAHARAFGLTPQPAGPGEEPEVRGGAWRVECFDKGDITGMLVELLINEEGVARWASLSPHNLDGCGDFDAFEERHSWCVGWRWYALDRAGAIVPRGAL